MLSSMTDPKHEVFKIKGLSGKRKLEGIIPVFGAKNAVLKVLAASPLFASPLTISNVPEIEDVHRSYELLEALGATRSSDTKRNVTITVPKKMITDLPTDIAKQFRASVVFTGPLLARYGKVSFPHPGGCVLGGRPIDVFLTAYEKLGATITHKNERYYISAPKGLTGGHIHFRIPSVTGTETVLMAASLAKGKTVLRNAAMEPEVVSLANFLQDSGVKIEGIGTPTLTIYGTNGKPLTAKKAYVTIPDRIEAGSFVVLAALLGKDVTITNCIPEHFESLLEHVKEMGVHFETTKNSVRVFRNEKTILKPVHIKTHEYPGFPTDLQSPMLVALTQAKGESTVWETIFEDRLRYTEGLQNMGANITTMNPLQVLVRGKTALRAKELQSPDLRAGIAFVIAAALATGTSTIGNVYNIDRGYENLDERLRAIGLSITRHTE
jgi:UDP-N-acetylglucosamine 1-carboxyvinyltransferase